MAAGTYTAEDLIARAMRAINVLPQGETPGAEEAADGLAALNDMVDSWSIDRLMTFTITRQLFSLIAGTQQYTLGAGGTFNFPRPPRLENAGVIILNNPAQPLELPLEMLNKDEWASVPVKNVQSNFPTSLYNDMAFPRMNLFFYPVPTTVSNIALYMWTVLQQFANLNTQYSFPPGYGRALWSNLAVEMSAMGFGGVVSAGLAKTAVESKALIKSLNSPEVIMGCDRALVNPELGQYNWITDQPAGRN